MLKFLITYGIFKNSGYKTIFDFINVIKMIPVETIPGMGGEGIK
jgi:hypothetical protein